MRRLGILAPDAQRCTFEEAVETIRTLKKKTPKVPKEQRARQATDEQVQTMRSLGVLARAARRCTFELAVETIRTLKKATTKVAKVGKTTPKAPKEQKPRKATEEQVQIMRSLGVRARAARRCTFELAVETIRTLKNTSVAGDKQVAIIPPSQIESDRASLPLTVPKGLLGVKRGRVYKDANGWWLTTRRGIYIAGPFSDRPQAAEFWFAFQESQGRKARALVDGPPCKAVKRKKGNKKPAARKVPTPHWDPFREFREPKIPRTRYRRPKIMRPTGGKKPGSHASGRHSR
jgi:hypothetical protein